MISKTLDELQLRARYGANVIGVERILNFHRVFVGVSTLSEFKAGDEIAILEAMKMENAVTTDYAGTVKQVLVQPGENVATDAVLVEIG